MHGCYARPFQKAKSTNATDSSFPSKVPVHAEPTNDGVHDLGIGGGGEVPSDAVIIPYSVGSENDTFNMRVIGWRRLSHGATLLWIPSILADLACTLGAQTGVAATAVVATELFCDAITITTEPVITSDVTNSGTSARFSPANDLIAWVSVPLYGSEKIEFTFDMATGDPTSANALFSLR